MRCLSVSAYITLVHKPAISSHSYEQPTSYRRPPDIPQSSIFHTIESPLGRFHCSLNGSHIKHKDCVKKYKQSLLLCNLEERSTGTCLLNRMFNEKSIPLKSHSSFIVSVLYLHTPQQHSILSCFVEINGYILTI